MRLHLTSLMLLILFSIVYPLELSEKESVRKLFYFSIQSKDMLKKFETYLKGSQQKLDRDFFIAYNGAYLTLVAKHAINPYTKYFRLKDGLELIGNSIQNKPDNLEYRFLRLSVLNYVPSFLGYDHLFYNDFEKIVELIGKKDYSEVDKNTQKGILEFLLRSSKLNEEQKKIVRKMYQEF